MRPLLLAAGLALSCFCCESQPEAASSPAAPNIVLLLADDLGYNDLSAYRLAHLDTSAQVPTCQTPYLDTLSAQGVRFTQFYTGAAVCSPSRAALLTGRNATRVGIYNWIPGNNPMHLRDSETTLAEMLNTAGYRSGHFGKWHMTSEGTDQPLPMEQGFEHAFYAFNNAKPSHENPVNYFRNGAPVGPLQGYACHLVADEALGWLDTVRGSGQPFFLNVWFNEPHEKVAAPDSLKRRHPYNSAYYGAIENMDAAILLGYETQPLPYREDYDQRATANLQPEPDAPPWSMWGFQPAHQAYLQNQEAQTFELYNIMQDPSQKTDVSSQYPGHTGRMKARALQLKDEMIRDGGNWYATDN